MTIVEALKKVVKAYDGAESKANTTVDALEDIVVAMGGTPSGGNTVQQVIEDIAATIEAGGGGGITPTGKINITTTAEVDVTSYATAQVVDSNLTAENIKKDVTILGTTGSYEGGSSDFSTAEVTVTNASGGVVKLEAPMVDTEENSTIFEMNIFSSDPVTVPIVLYKGLAFGGVANGEEFSYTFTGGIEGESGELVITGNGTILIEAGTT